MGRVGAGRDRERGGAGRGVDKIGAGEGLGDIEKTRRPLRHPSHPSESSPPSEAAIRVPSAIRVSHPSPLRHPSEPSESAIRIISDCGVEGRKGCRQVGSSAIRVSLPSHLGARSRSCWDSPRRAVPDGSQAVRAGPETARAASGPHGGAGWWGRKRPVLFRSGPPPHRRGRLRDGGAEADAEAAAQRPGPVCVCGGGSRTSACVGEGRDRGRDGVRESEGGRASESTRTLRVDGGAAPLSPRATARRATACMNSYRL